MFKVSAVTTTTTYHILSDSELSVTEVEGLVYDNVLNGVRYKEYDIDVVDIDTCIVDGVEYNKYTVVVDIRY